jgi:rare lipoprotein A
MVAAISLEMTTRKNDELIARHRVKSQSASMFSRSFFVGMALACLMAAAPAFASSAKSYSIGDKERGYASWYNEGSKTASGETFDRHQLTAAHRSLPFGSIVRVTSRSTGLSVDVRINDRGALKDNRIIDVSEAAADILKMKQAGTIPVEIKVIRLGASTSKKPHKKGWFW